ncbi:MAG: restriction endonuclease subunit S [Akkermansia muciniphila]|nr:restriction endonuclease subunit S [Akkermansia muciniphila]
MKSYPAYKHSGVPWLGEIPEHWTFVRTKTLLRPKKVLLGNNERKLPMLSLTKNGIILRDLSTGKGKFSADESNFLIVEPGDFVFCHFDVQETPRTVGLSSLSGYITGAYNTYKYTGGFPRFFYYLQEYYDDHKLLRPLYGGMRNTIKPGRFLSMRVALPPETEQSAIAAYLDKKCGEIDEMVRRRQAIIERLRELKQALIAKAVTKGLHPEVPMKDSGIPWLGQIPEGWEIERLQWHLEEIRETNSPVKTNQVLSLTNKRGIIPYEEKGNQGNTAKEKVDEYKLAYPDTLVINSMNVIIGSVGICRYFGCVSPVYYVYKAVGNTDLTYVNYIFQTSLFQKELRRHAKGILEIRLRLSSSDIRKCLVPVPPLPEQQEIAAYLDKKCAAIDELISRHGQIVEKLRELKASTIAHVVTGKIDIRERA